MCNFLNLQFGIFMFVLISLYSRQFVSPGVLSSPSGLSKL